MSVASWDSAANVLAEYSRRLRRRRGAAVLRQVNGEPWTVALYGRAGDPPAAALAALEGLLPGLGLKTLGAGHDTGRTRWAVVIGPTARRPRSFARDPEQAARLASLLQTVLDELAAAAH